jgi:Flp pilus assembly protein TadG
MTQTLHSNERGAAAVEFALVLPLLMLLLFGIIEFGRAYNAKVTLTHAAREGARALAVDDGDPIAVTKDAAASLDPSKITVTTTVCEPGETGEVTATYQMTFSIPLFGDWTSDLSATGAMRCGG